MNAAGFFSEPHTVEIPSRDAPVELNGRDYSYRVFDREEVTVDGETLKGAPKNFGPRHIRGDIYDAERVRREVPDNDILLSNMRCTGWTHVIKCAQGFVPMKEGDVIIP